MPNGKPVGPPLGATGRVVPERFLILAAMSYILIAVATPLCALAQTSGPTSYPDIVTAASLVVWPVRAAYHRSFTDRAVILSLAADPQADSTSDVILIHTAGRIEALAASTGRRLWPRSVACRREPLLIGSDENRHILATPHRIFALRRVDGRLSWQYGERPTDDAGVDPESLTVWTDLAMTVDRLVARSDRGELICVDLRDGNLRWRRDDSGAEAGRLVMHRHHLSYVQRRGLLRTLCVLDASSGEPIRTIDLDGDTPCQSLSRVADGGLLVLHSRTMLCIEPDAGAMRWRVRTSGRFMASTLATSGDGVFISDDGRHVTKYDLRTGRALWQTPPIGAPDGHGGLWVRIAAGRLLTAASGMLAASDPTDGRVLWVAHNPPNLQAHPPVLVGDAIVTMELATNGGATQPADGERVISAHSDSHRYRIRRFDLSDGRERSVIAGGELITRPLGASTRMWARRNALVILDGQRLIGYVGANDRKPKREP